MPQLYVGNLPRDCKESELRPLIERVVGRVVAIKMTFRSFCFVDLASQSDLDLALTSHPPSLRGRRLKFAPARTRAAVTQ